MWDIPVQQLEADLSAGIYDRLVDADPSERELDQTKRLGDGARYYLAIVFERLGRQSLSDRLFELEILDGTEPWRTEALRRYFDGLIGRSEYERLDALSSEVLEGEPEHALALSYRIESRYWRTLDAQVIDDIEALGAMGPLPDFKAGEIALFNSVSSTRLQNAEWQRRIGELYHQYPYGRVHDRLYQFLVRGGYIEQIDEETMLLIAGFAEYSHGEVDVGAGFLRTYLADNSAIIIDGVSDHFIRSVSAVLISSAQKAAGAEIISAIADSAGTDGPSARLRLLREFAGKLYRADRRYREAEAEFRTAVLRSADPYQRDRMRWYLVDSIANRSLSDAVEELESTAADWNDQGLLDDAVERIVPALVQRRSFGSLVQLGSSLEESVARTSAARIAFIVASALNADIHTDPSIDVESLLTHALHDGERYYAVLAAAALGREPPFLAGLDNVTADAPDGGMSDSDAITGGYLRFGLIDLARDAVEYDTGGHSPATIRRVADALNNRKEHLKALRLMGRLSQRPDYGLTRADMEADHPQAFLPEILESANSVSLPVHIFYGMVRTESFFDPEIVSRAGAVGLSQLMPDTTAEIAQRLRVTDADVYDPQTNLSFGAWYLSHLAGRTDSLADAVFAYNAGLTRVRTWRKQYPGLPDELFLEMIPIDETRTHGMKVLVSASIYGYLYFGKTVADTVGSYFSNFGF